MEQLLSCWVEKKKRNKFYSLFSEWDRRWLTCDNKNITIYTEQHIVSHVIPIIYMESITPFEDLEFIITVKERSFTLRTNNKEQRDHCVFVITTLKTKIEREKTERLKKANDEINHYIASLHPESILNHFRSNSYK